MIKVRINNVWPFIKLHIFINLYYPFGMTLQLHKSLFVLKERRQFNQQKSSLRFEVIALSNTLTSVFNEGYSNLLGMKS